ncbi:helix-turn-helix domain-containing protein [Desulfosediminicola sp.]|uniref:AraC family transcriptional regulator n=1 Tax=Desulfosediminicola sp. TaxID=2886825 RepID=UPI003AF2BC2C
METLGFAGTPLSQFPVLQKAGVEGTRRFLTDVFEQKVVIEPGKGERPFIAHSYARKLSKMTIISNCFTKEIATGGPEGALGKLAFQFCIRGSLFCTINGTRVSRADHSRVSVLSPNQKVEYYSGDDTLSVVCFLDESKLRDFLFDWSGEKFTEKILFKPELNLQSPKVSSFVAIFSNFINELNRKNGMLDSPVAQESFQQALYSFILLELPSSISKIMEKQTRFASLQEVRKVEEFLEANAGNPLDMKTVALATGHSLRSIYRSFQRERGYTPSEFLRKVRLENVRRRLLCPAPDDSVTRIAYEFGFAHLGRFAGLYKKAYGESPGDTIKASMRHRR